MMYTQPYYEYTQIYNESEIPKKKRKIRNKFSPEEDQKLRELVQKHGEHSWNLISSLMENRNQRQCRERWKHYLSCDLKESIKPWTKDEDMIIMTKYNELGAKWTKIAKELPGRSDLQVKNRYFKNIKNTRKSEKKLTEASNDFVGKEVNDKKLTDIENNENKCILPCNTQIKKEDAEMDSFGINSILSEAGNNEYDFNSQFDLYNTNLITEFYRNDIFDQDFIPGLWSFE